MKTVCNALHIPFVFHDSVKKQIAISEFRINILVLKSERFGMIKSVRWVLMQCRNSRCIEYGGKYFLVVQGK